MAANKVIRYLAETAEPRVKKFILLSPSNIQHLRNFVPQEQKDFVLAEYQKGNLEKLLPFELLGWLPCLVRTGYQWLFSDILDNVHLEKDGDFSQIAKIKHTGALLIGTYDRFTYGEPRDFGEIFITAHCSLLTPNYAKIPPSKKAGFKEKTCFFVFTFKIIHKKI